MAKFLTFSTTKQNSSIVTRVMSSKMLLMRVFLILTLTYYCLRADNDLLSKFTQSDYQVKDVRTEIDRFDETILSEFKLITFKYNRSTPAINYSTVHKIDFGDKVEVLTQAYKFVSNEFRVFPMRYQISLTKAYKANILGVQRVTKCGFFNKTYFVKNVRYSVCNYVIDASKSPPLLPTGMYKMQLTFIYRNQEYAVINLYGEVYRPIYPPKEKKNRFYNP